MFCILFSGTHYGYYPEGKAEAGGEGSRGNLCLSGYEERLGRRKSIGLKKKNVSDAGRDTTGLPLANSAVDTSKGRGCIFPLPQQSVLCSMDEGASFLFPTYPPSELLLGVLSSNWGGKWRGLVACSQSSFAP